MNKLKALTVACVAFATSLVVGSAVAGLASTPKFGHTFNGSIMNIGSTDISTVKDIAGTYVDGRDDGVQAFQLSGAGATGNTTGYNIGTSTFTIGMIAKVPDLGDNRICLCAWGPGNDNGDMYGLYVQGNTVSFDYHRGTEHTQVISAEVQDITSFHTYVLTSNAKSMKLYVDGTPVTDAVQYGGLLDTRTAYGIFAVANGQTASQQGCVDSTGLAIQDWRLYTEVLSDADIGRYSSSDAPTVNVTIPDGFDDSWENIPWEADPPTTDAFVTMTFEGTATIDLGSTSPDGVSFTFANGAEGELVTIKGEPNVLADFVGKVAFAEFVGSVEFSFDVTTSSCDASGMLSVIKSAGDKVAFKFVGDGDCGVTLPFGSSTATLGTHIILAGGTHTMTWQNGNTKFGTNGTNDNPTLWITDGATLNLSAKDLSGWSGDVSVDGVVRVDDGSTLNITQIESSTFFYHQRFYLEPGSLTTFNFDANTAGNGESRFRIRGGAVAGREQIYVPASEEQAFARPAVIRQLGEGAFHLGSDGTRSCAVYVGKNSKLQFDASISTWTGGGAQPILLKMGEGAIEVTREPTTGSQCGAVTLDMTEGIISLTETIGLGSATMTSDVTYIFPAGTTEDSPIGIATTIDVPSDKLLNKTVYVADADATVEPTMIEDKTLVYAENTVAYSEGLLSDNISDKEITVADIVNLFKDSIGEPTEVQVGFTCTEDPVTLYFAAGDLELLTEAQITKVYVQRNFEETEAVTLMVQPVDGITAAEYSALAEMFDFTDVIWLFDGRESYVAQEGEDVTASKINAKLLGFEGVFTLILNGGNFTLDQELNCSNVVIESPVGVDVAIEIADGYELTEAELAKIDVSDVGGVAIWNIPLVSGKACWMDYEFNGDLSNIGQDTGAMSRDAGGFGGELTSDFRPVAEGGYDAVYSATHPYRDWSGFDIPNNFSCAVACTLPPLDKCALMMFGSSAHSNSAGKCGVIGLMTGSIEDSTVYLVYIGGQKGVDMQRYKVLAEMKVPNAFDREHLYIFNKLGNTVEVYLDGKPWTTYTSEEDIVLGNGMQLCSINGGIGDSGVNWITKDTYGLDDPRTRQSTINTMRVYKAKLGQKAIDALVEEFPYECPNGTYMRTFSGEETWSATEAWTKDGDETKYDLPANGSVLELTPGESDSVITLDAAGSYESISIDNGETSITFIGENQIVNLGSTYVNAPITIDKFALSISGGPTVIGENGSICFNLEGVDLAQYAGSTIKLTGTMEPTDNVIIIPPKENPYYTVEAKYDDKTSQYILAITAKPREGIGLHIAEEGEEITVGDTTAFVDGEGNPIPRIAEDWLVVADTRAITFDLTTPFAKIVVEDGGYYKQVGSVYTGEIELVEGGTFDVNGLDNNSANIMLNGGTLATTKTTLYTHIGCYKIDFEADSIVSVIQESEEAPVVLHSLSNGWNRFNYNLNGHKLTKTGAGEYLISNGSYVDGGAIEVAAGKLTMDSYLIPAEAMLDLTIDTDATLKVSNGQNKTLDKEGTLNVTLNENAKIELVNGVVPEFDSVVAEANWYLDFSSFSEVITEDGITVMKSMDLDATKITPIWPEDGNEYELIYDDETGVLSARIVPIKIMGTMMYLR